MLYGIKNTYCLLARLARILLNDLDCFLSNTCDMCRKVLHTYIVTLFYSGNAIIVLRAILIRL